MSEPLPPPVTIDYGRVPIFPLPETVLFPRTHLPLHIFEPRYRAMTEACIEQGLPMAIALAKPGEDLAGVADVFPVAGVGVIERHERLPDGRFNIVLRGVARMHIEEELPHSPWRMVRGRELSDCWPSAPESLAVPSETLQACVAGIIGLASDPDIASKVLRRMEAAKADAGFLADTIAAMFVDEAMARQALLEELEVEKRVHEVTSRLAELLLRAQAARGGSEPVQ